jgi:hypothetical protein
MPLRARLTSITIMVCVGAIAAGAGGCAGGGSNNASVVTHPTTEPNGAAVQRERSAIAGANEVVANIGETKITKGELVHAMGIGPVKAEVPDAPRFTECVAKKRHAASGKGKSASQLRALCRVAYVRLERPTLAGLIGNAWVAEEARALGIRIRDAQIVKQYQEDIRNQLPSPSALAAYLRTSGQTVADLLATLRTEALREALRKAVTRDVEVVPEAAVAAYYRAHRQLYAVAEHMELEVIETYSRKEAAATLAKLRAGQSFSSLAHTQVIERPKSEAGGSKLKELEHAILHAKLGVLTGPVRHKADYFLFKVKREIPGRQESVTSVAAKIKEQLGASRRTGTLGAFVARWRGRWRERTHCVRGYVVAKCSEFIGRAPHEDPVTLN